MFGARLRRAAQTAANQWVDPLFSDRHPSPMLNALIRAAGPAVRLLQPNDRWNLAAFIDDWIRILDVPPYQPLPPKKRIFMFGCYRGQFTRDLVLALLLAWRGHQVTLGYLPKLRSPVKPPLDDAPGVQGYLEELLMPLADRTRGQLHCVDMSAFAGRNAAIDERYLAASARAETILKLGQERLDTSDPQMQAALDHYCRIGRQAQEMAHAYFDEHFRDFDLAIIANGASFENGHFRQAAMAHGVPVNTHEKFAFRNVVVVNHGDAFFHFNDLDRIWFRRTELGFLDEPAKSFAIAGGWDLLRQRQSSSGRAWSFQYQKDRPSRSAEDIEATLDIERDGFVLVCPNVPFDAGYDGWLDIFPSMREWLVETVRALLDQGSWKIVARAHPAETRPTYGREKIKAVFEEAGLVSSRLVVVPGDSDINTYDLMPLCRFACVFASTTGIEIAMHGKPVLAGASVYYARCGITVPAIDRKSYWTALDTLATAPIADLSEQADDAAMLYFMFHYLLQWAFPYDKPSQISLLPLRQIAGDADIDLYIETLDTLAMTEREYVAALPDLMQFDRVRRRLRK